ncbi:MAG: excinuclease ABC subunit UvrC [Candidatus Babeliales bacterium]
MNPTTTLIATIKKLPALPGVYIFKDNEGQIIYVGKAKDLKKRVISYVQLQGKDFKADTIMATATSLEHIVTDSELEAMLIEAQLIQAHQPNLNILLKTGQPFLYLVITSSTIPELKIVRNKKQKGTYFGPFIEKASARNVYDFLIKTFRLKRCGKKIENGCLYYHMGICSGSCRPDFGHAAYLERIELAKAALKQGHTKFLKHLEQLVAEQSKQRNFEKAKTLHAYHKAFQSVYEALDVKQATASHLVQRDIWILAAGGQSICVFNEQNSVLKKKQIFYAPLMQSDSQEPWYLEYFLSYYRIHPPCVTILVNFDLPKTDKDLYQTFLQQWHALKYPVTIDHPTKGHAASLVRLALIHAEQEVTRTKTLSKALMQFLGLKIAPKTIDCFDISHTQGHAMVGSCVRFTDGEPDPKNFRHFHIKTLDHQDDCAALQEIVSRRYKGTSELPDLILIDGGKGQLSATKSLFPSIPCASLAKKEEIVYATTLPQGKKLDVTSFVGQLLIALRDYTHHFAITFHRKISKL